ncbi:MAG: Flp pilus assembly protein CpaB [Pseudomonadota bacterium]
MDGAKHMKRGQLISLGIAGVTGVAAVFGLQAFVSQQPKEVVRERTVNTARVLVARRDISLGEVTTEASFKWQNWPSDALTPAFITANSNPQAHRELAGSVARAPVLGGEPITNVKLIQAGKGGVLAAILPSGKRAVSTSISEESAVAKMILPNDHVDVILTRRKNDRGGQQEFVSDTLFRNIRVLAIGQTIEAKEGKKDAEGNVATLELTPRQAELLALANEMGTINLALRSIADITSLESSTGDALTKKEAAPSAVNITRYGITTRQYGVN